MFIMYHYTSVLKKTNLQSMVFVKLTFLLKMPGFKKIHNNKIRTVYGPIKIDHCGEIGIGLPMNMLVPKIIFI